MRIIEIKCIAIIGGGGVKIEGSILTLKMAWQGIKSAKLDEIN
mgnify:CR=1 FL=1